MTFGLFIVLGVTLAIFVRELIRKEGIYELPFIASSVYLGWVIPQLVGLQFDQSLPDGSLLITCLYAALCLLALEFGNRAGRAPFRFPVQHLDNNLLFPVAIALSIAGAVFYLLVRVNAETATIDSGGQWSGEITIWSFFSRLLTFGLVVSIAGLLQRPSKGWWVLIAFNALFYVDRIISGGRRSELAELMLIASFIALFRYNIRVPRTLVLVALVAGTLFINGIGEYRARAQDRIPSLSDIAEIDFIGNMVALTQQGGEELRNATMTIDASLTSSEYNLGGGLWNSLVHHYVPAQIVGADIKSALTLDLPNPLYELHGYTPYTGSTYTGIGDSFAAFSFFGAALFYFYGWFYQRLFVTAKSGSAVAMLILLVMITPALLSITHSIWWAMKDTVQVFVFLYLPLLFARARRKRATSVPNPGGPQEAVRGYPTKGTTQGR
jgi:oligosaccharide repeat unit polymerase